MINTPSDIPPSISVDYSTPVRQIMTSSLVTISPITTLKEAERIFKNQSFHHLPVVKKDGHIIGMLNKKDLAIYQKVLTMNALNNETYLTNTFPIASDLMSTQLTILRPEDPLQLAAEIFSEDVFRAIPITHKGILKGIITCHDLVNYILKNSISHSSSHSYRKK